jgi:hypothetical protein
VGLDGVQDAGCAVDGGIEEVGLHVGDVEVEGACRVEDCIERWGALDGGVEGVGSRDVWDEHKGELVRGVARENVEDCGALGGGANSEDYIVAFAEKGGDAVSRDEPATTSDENLHGCKVEYVA